MVTLNNVYFAVPFRVLREIYTVPIETIIIHYYLAYHLFSDDAGSGNGTGQVCSG
jgi:hypothetical protein